MVRVRISEGQRITENGGRFLKRNPMLPAISANFGRVPFEIHGLILLYFLREGPFPLRKRGGIDALFRKVLVLFRFFERSGDFELAEREENVRRITFSTTSVLRAS